MAAVTLRDALESVEGTLITKRREGLEDLRRILRHNQTTGKIDSLGDDSFHRIFEALFQAALKEKAQVVKGSSTTTRTAATNRLTDVAATFRQWMESGARYLTKVKTVRSVLKHVTETIRYDSTKEFCEPLALEYAKSLRALFSHQPHVERLGGDWKGIVEFVVGCIRKASSEETAENGDPASTMGTTNSHSYRSSRSAVRDGTSSQGYKSGNRAIIAEMVACLHLLASAPNAPMGLMAEEVLIAAIEYLKTSNSASAANHDAFGAINHVLTWSRTEAVDLTKSTTSALIRLISRLWSSKSNAIDQMLSTLLLLQPYYVHEMQQSSAHILRPELSSLLQVLFAEYSKRIDRDRLNLDELRLKITTSPHLSSGEVSTGMFELRCCGARSESNWLLLYILASLYQVLPFLGGGSLTRFGRDDRDDADSNSRHRKRLRSNDNFDDLLNATSQGDTSSRIAAIQVLAFFAQQKSMTPDRLLRVLNSLSSSCNEENSNIAAWAFLALACYASQNSASDAKLATHWATFWQVACRSLSNAFVCRSASYALHVMMKLHLVSHATVSELVQSVTNAMDLSGPTLPSDAATLFLSSILEASQHLNASTSSKTVESILHWTTQNITPSKFDDRAFALGTVTYEASDVMWLLCVCLNQETYCLETPNLRVWDQTARTWLLCGGHAPLVSYLLLSPAEEPTMHPGLRARASTSLSIRSIPPLPSHEALVLSHFAVEVTRTLSAWNQQRQERLQSSLDSFTTLCKGICLVCAIATSLTFRDAHRLSQLQSQTSTLLDTVANFVSSTECDDAKADIFMSILSATMTGLILCRDGHGVLTFNDGEPSHRPTACEKLVSRALAKATASRQAHTQEHSEQDAMDLDDEFQSQGSSQILQSMDTPVLRNDLEVAFGKSALRQGIALYAHAIAALCDEEDGANGTPTTASDAVMDYLQQSDTTIFVCRDIVKALPRLGIDLPASDVYLLLENLMKLTKKLTYARSEVSLGACLDIMLSQAHHWVDPENDELYKLGLDLYDWWTVGQLEQSTMSSNVQERLADLLIRLCQLQENYAADEPDASTPRTALFKLLKQGRVTLQFHLADKIPTIFRSFILTTHESIFDDLQSSLSEEIGSLEGMALRLLVLANLGSEWPSLLRRCVYYIFEAAGRAASTSQHAKYCVQQLAARLPLGSPQKLFSLFAPQLLYTWFDTKETLERIPYDAFQYSSLKELLLANESEVSAQLVLNDCTADLTVMSTLLAIAPEKLLQGSFPKVFAYALGRDLDTTPGTPVVETRLKGLIGGKEQAKALTNTSFPVIMGHLYLTMQQDDIDDKWLEKSGRYPQAASRLAEIKNHSCSRRPLPRSQQPSFSSSHFLDELERLYRRINQTNASECDPSWFAVVARMLLNAIDESLGSLHTSLMIRRLRALISLSGETAFYGFGLEMVLHSLRPFVSTQECTDDVLGILWYLFDHSRVYLSSSLVFLRGAIMLLVLQMRRYARTGHDHMTQQSQHKATVGKMTEFQNWLVTYLRETIGAQPRSSDSTLLDALTSLRLPGNARRDTAESSLLLFLLEQRGSSDPLCSRADTTEAISLLSEDFQAAPSVSDDCLGDDSEATRFSYELWQAVQEAAFSEPLVTWAAQVVGRSYAATGVRPDRSVSVRQQRSISQDNIIASSQYTIATRMSSLLFSRKRHEAGLADACLRSFFEFQGENADEVVAFEQMLPGSVLEVIRNGSFHYQPPFAARPSDLSKANVKALREVLDLSSSITLDEWTTSIALTLCSYASKAPEVEMLAPLFHAPSELAAELLPSMIHLLLYKEIDKARTLHAELSAAFSACLNLADTCFHAQQRFILDLLVYLRGQVYPGEATKADRSNWLNIDCTSATEAGARSGRPTTGLLFAELEAPISVPQGNKRSSTRTSLSQNLKSPVSDELLLRIYEQIAEPDSFYGVDQPASLTSVLNRLDHESDGFKGLMFRAAQMDSNMRNAQATLDKDAAGMVHSLSDLNFNSLTLTLLSHGVGNSASDMLTAAQALQQWDLAVPEAQSAPSSTVFTALQELSRATSLDYMQTQLQPAIVRHARYGLESKKSGSLPTSWYTGLAQMTEIAELLASTSKSEMVMRWQLLQSRKHWMHLSKFEDAEPIVSNRQNLFGVLRRNSDIQKLLHLDRKQCHVFEAEALLEVSRFSREHARLQSALTAVTSLGQMSTHFEEMGLNIAGMIKRETASVLWHADEASASIKMLRDALSLTDGKQDVSAGAAGLLAQLGHQLAEARLEKPEDILSTYLKPAISELNKQKSGEEAGNVYHEFAAFCDNELQSASNKENLERIVKNRQAKEQEIEALELAIRNIKRTGGDRQEMQKSLNSARKWFEIDSAEEKRLFKEQQIYVHQSLQNYLLALQASDDHDLDVLRFFALWLENSEDEDANAIALRYIKDVPSWKFVLLMNQLMSRVGDDKTTFQHTLQQLLVRICGDHPHHSLHHLFAARSSMGSDAASKSRYTAAMQIFKEIQHDPKRKVTVDNIFRIDALCDGIANWEGSQRNNGKHTIKDCKEATNLAQTMPRLRLPPMTMSIPLRPSCRYDNLPVVTKFDARITVMAGNSAPKALTCTTSDGVLYKQLFKAGDDLRQDAIMEQVFEEVSKMLRNHKATRQRDLKVRTYKVVPLSSKSGVIEFVPNSIPLNDFLRPAHRKYYPHGYANDKARQMVDEAQKRGASVDERARVFRKVCENMPPVLRHFFFERFNDPDEWFQKRTAYTRTTASISILGHILGLGDRHNSNIMLDQGTGEVVHIDLGVAFEAGRVLPIPELVPFRLTRDIVDGMGITKTEGVFRRCCEFTLDAVREDKGSIMTLLNVLRYDPLYSWQSNARAKKMQEAQGAGRGGGRGEENSSKKREQEAGEADRALSIVEKKLSKTLSTAATVNELIQQAMDERNLGTLFCGWAAWF